MLCLRLAALRGGLCPGSLLPRRPAAAFICQQCPDVPGGLPKRSDGLMESESDSESKQQGNFAMFLVTWAGSTAQRNRPWQLLPRRLAAAFIC